VGGGVTAIQATRRTVKELVDGTLRVQIDIDPKDKAAFLQLFPDVDLPMAIAALTIPAEQPKATGEHIANLYRSGFFMREDVWAAAGTTAEYEAWARTQPCAYCKSNGEHNPQTGEFRCEFAHVRRIAQGAGTNIKPDGYGIPLCHDCHAQQHQKGESSFGKAKDWFDSQVVRHRSGWVHEVLRDTFKVDHLSDVSIEDIRQWSRDKGIQLGEV